MKNENENKKPQKPSVAPPKPLQSVDRCLMCGAPVPEGRFICPWCERGK